MPIVAVLILEPICLWMPFLTKKSDTPKSVTTSASLHVALSLTSERHSATSASAVMTLGVRTYKRGTVNRGTVKRGQLIAGQLIARTHNRSDN